MAMISVDSSSLLADYNPTWLAWFKNWQPPGAESAWRNISDELETWAVIGCAVLHQQQ